MTQHPVSPKGQFHKTGIIYYYYEWQTLVGWPVYLLETTPITSALETLAYTIVLLSQLKSP